MSTAENTKQTDKKKVLGIVLDVFLWLFLAFSLAMTVLAFTATASGNGNPMIAGHLILSVKTDSMEGDEGFCTDDLIFGRVLTDDEKRDLKVGDVITFYMDLNLDDGINQKELNTHRIIEVSGSGDSVTYHTKGDNEEYADYLWVTPNDVEAIWTGSRIPVLGGIIGFLQSSTGFLVCVVIPLLLFFLYKLYEMIKAILVIRGEKKPKISAEDEEEIKRRAVAEYIAKMQAEQAEAQAGKKENAEETGEKEESDK